MATYAYTLMSPAEEARLLRAPKMGTVELPDDDEIYDAYSCQTSSVSPRTRQSSAAGFYPNALNVHFGYDCELSAIIEWAASPPLPCPKGATEGKGSCSALLHEHSCSVCSSHLFLSPVLSGPQMAQSSPLVSHGYLYCEHPAYEPRTEFAPGMYSRPATPQSPSYPYTYARSPSLPSPQYTGDATYGYSPRKTAYMSPPPSPPPAAATLPSSPRAKVTRTPRTRKSSRLSP